MNGWKVVLGIALFAAVTAGLYLWGLRKSVAQEQDLYRRLRGKCAGRLLRRLKKSGQLTETQAAELIDGVRVGDFWSKNRAAVLDKDQFLEELLVYLQDQRLIRREDGRIFLK